MHDPENGQEQSLRMILEGEFGFFGLISLVPSLPVALLSWQYERVSTHSRRTVACSSTTQVPHGQDALVYHVLLELNQVYKADPDSPLILTLTDLFWAIQGTFPEVSMDEPMIYLSILRLNDAIMTVKDFRTQPWAEETRIFSFLDSVVVTWKGVASKPSTDLLTLKINTDLAQLNRLRR